MNLDTIKRLKTFNDIVTEHEELLRESNDICQKQIEKASSTAEIEEAVKEATKRGRTILLYTFEKKKKLIKEYELVNKRLHSLLEG